jgi:hypothetical protein
VCSKVYIGDIKHHITLDITGIILPYLLTLANRNNPISLTTPKVAKAITLDY